MGELEEEYGERATFVVVPAEETAKRGSELDEFGFTDLRHGLVIFDADGVPRVKLPGHDFGKERIEAGLAEVLARR